jgi:pilus assembly protein Flp/PilA
VWVARVVRNQRAQGMVEYALILVLVAIIVVIALSALGRQISHVFESITGKLQTT